MKEKLMKERKKYIVHEKGASKTPSLLPGFLKMVEGVSNKCYPSAATWC